MPPANRRRAIRDPVRRIGIIGRLTPWKGQHVFLAAFARAFQDSANTITGAVIGSAMFGEDDYARSLHAQAEQLGIAERIEFAGFRSDIEAELDRLDVLVHASVLPDPLATVVTEGMAAGIPVVSSEAGGHAEHVQHEVHGLKYPPGDVPALAEALRRIVADRNLRERLSSEGLRLAQRFSADIVLGDTLILYDRMAARSHG